MTSHRTRVGLCAAALLAAGPVHSAADESPALLVLALEDQANEIWSALPDDAGDPRLTVRGGSGECAAAALRQAKSALAQAGGGRMALRTLSLALPVSRAVLADLARGRPSAERIAPFVTADTRSDHVSQPLSGEDCEDTAAFYDLRAVQGSPGRLALHLLLEGACGCPQGAGGRVRFQLLGDAELEPGLVEKKNVLRLRTAAPRYSLLAACGACEEGKAPRAVQPAAADPCAAPCASLAGGFAAWQREATQAAAKATELAGKATTLELDIRTQRQELESAQAGARKPRPVLERISALQDRIKAAQAELARVTRASQEIQKYLDASRQASEQARGADDRCRSQCQARSSRSPREQASAGSTGAAGGSGISSGVLIAGGAALAAGAVAVVAAGGGEDASGAAEPSFAGTWRGTRTTDALVRPPLRCMRTFDETWVITQNGRDLHADITATAQSCGDPVACGPCQIFAFPREHPGTADGSVARFFVFPELQVPSCVLPLRLQGDTLSGAMPACQTGNDITLGDVVTLRRVSP